MGRFRKNFPRHRDGAKIEKEVYCVGNVENRSCDCGSAPSRKERKEEEEQEENDPPMKCRWERFS